MSQTRIYVRTKLDPKVVKKLPHLSAAEWKKLNKSKPRLVTDESRARALAAHNKACAENLKTLSKTYKSKARLARFNPGDKTANSSPRIDFTSADGKPRSVRALNRDAMVHDALVARALLQSRTNQARTYADTLALLKERAKKIAGLSKKLNDCPKAFDVGKTAVTEIDQGIANLTSLAREFAAWKIDLPTSIPTGRPASCGNEEGTGNGGDSTDCPARTPSARGLLRNNNWPLKFFTTCIRNQGPSRGTCPSFSIVAAMECCIAAQKNRWVNLSEQDLYKHLRHDWNPTDDFDDGGSAPLSLLFQLLTGYVFPWERDWDYNPSPKRVPDPDHRTYSHSCDLYNNTNCSDTNHQSHQSCFQFDEPTQHTITRIVSTWVEEVVTIVENVVDWLGSLVGQKTHTEIWGHWVEETVTEVHRYS